MIQLNNISETKRKVRKLKIVEKKIRFGDDTSAGAALVWDSFFDLRDPPASNARYTLASLALMNREDYKRVVDEYFACVYYELYKENGIFRIATYDPFVLAQLGLPFNAEMHEIKKRFRELAMLYHPDTGGDSARFIELMKIYEKLTGKE